MRAVSARLCGIAALASCLARARSYAAFAAAGAASGLKTLAAAATHEQIVKKSKFVAHAQAVQSFEEAKEFIARVSDPKATHNCWAYRDPSCERSSDDGEPSGTAGRPILAALAGCDLHYTCCVVTRYFGGIKLGTGGLVRAYGSTAKACLQSAPTKVVAPMEKLTWRVALQDVPAAMALFAAGRHHIESQVFGEAAAEMTVLLPASQQTGLADKMNAATQGRAVLVQPDGGSNLQR